MLVWRARTASLSTPVAWMELPMNNSPSSAIPPVQWRMVDIQPK
jgi:hypothetical protein